MSAEVVVEQYLHKITNNNNNNSQETLISVYILVLCKPFCTIFLIDVFNYCT